MKDIICTFFEKCSKQPHSASMHILIISNLERVALRRTLKPFIRLTAKTIPFLSFVFFAFKRHVTPYMKIWSSEVRRSRWQILLSITGLRIQALRHVSTEMLACSSRWKNMCSRVSRMSFRRTDSSFGKIVSCLHYRRVRIYVMPSLRFLKSQTILRNYIERLILQ